MKKTVLAVLLALAAGAAQAQDNSLMPPIEKTTPVTITVSDTDTVRGITISSQTPTDIILSTPPGYRSVTVYNLNVASSVYCGERPVVSTQTASDLVGHPVPAGAVYGNPWTFYIRPGTLFYCIVSHVTSSGRISILRAR